MEIAADLNSQAALLDAADRLAEAERKGDIAALGQLLADDYQGYDPAGRSQDRAVVLRGYSEGWVRLTSLRQSELQARVLGSTGVVVGINAIQGQEGTERIRFRLRFLDVYAVRDGRWQLVASQDTLLP